MRLTSKGRYAVRAMLDLTIHTQGNPVRLQEISKRQSISLHYLEQLFRKLRTGNVVKSVRGPGGGYVLARSRDEISVKDILGSVGENINPARDILGIPSSGVDMKDSNGEDIIVDTQEFNITKNYFENLGVIMQEYLISTTLGDLCRRSSITATAENNSNNAGANGGNNGTTTNTNNGAYVNKLFGSMDQ
ncbi:MAG: Rrf2 family transcriptional regulator [Bacteriovoracaceae bacterium]|nr:Rrf2 family transcriptional regulator [Bacteriovoracaceae bacterium]